MVVTGKLFLILLLFSYGFTSFYKLYGTLFVIPYHALLGLDPNFPHTKCI